jgi:hypothetical protein
MKPRTNTVLWREDSWQCELSFAGADVRLRLFDDQSLIFDQIVQAGIEALQQANAWRTAISQVQKAKDSSQRLRRC